MSAAPRFCAQEPAKSSPAFASIRHQKSGITIAVSARSVRFVVDSDALRESCSTLLLWTWLRLG
jgi:hypothetical protein